MSMQLGSSFHFCLLTKPEHKFLWASFKHRFITSEYDTGLQVCTCLVFWLCNEFLSPKAFLTGF